MAEHHGPPPLFGIAAEFVDGAQLRHAVAEARRIGLSRVDAYSPGPVEGLAELLDGGGRHLLQGGIAAALLGLVGFFGLCTWQTMVEYPFLIGGRPAFSWPYFVIPSTSIGMLVGALGTTLFMLHLNRLPRLNHPAFNIAGFERASRDRYFLTVEAVDDHFDIDAVLRFLRALRPAPLRIQQVPR